MSTRRDALVALSPLSTGSFADAQKLNAVQAKRIGVLDLGEESKPPRAERPFWVALQRKGWTLGQNLMVEPAYANWKAKDLEALADGLVRKRVDLILSEGAQATIAAARATRTIPILFRNVLWPLELGLVDSYARPGRNLTGHMVYTGLEIGNKRIQFMREILPAATRLSWILGSSRTLETLAGGSIDMPSVSESYARALGFECKFHLTTRTTDLDHLFAEFASWRAQAVIAQGPVTWKDPQYFAELALRQRLPTAFYFREHVEAGGLLCYGVPESERDRITAHEVEYVDRILQGAQPADLPVQRPSRYELVINMKTAKALGITIPQSLLVRTDEIIQ